MTPHPKTELRAPRLMADAIGQLMEFWNFKSNLGRIWTLLYLSPEPISAAGIADALELSAGAVSMATNELLRWKAIRKIHQPGERKDFFAAETDLWKLITGVLSDRERREIESALDTFRQALAALDAEREHYEAKDFRFKKERIERMFQLASLGKAMLDTLLTQARLDMKPIREHLDRLKG
ncbi:MAG: ArsR family transcriptional regulator [Deltaproteobacteria bacterium]|nr:ArsR family transcriptional regulator [Deltaproteobacteria bacterium]